MAWPYGEWVTGEPERCVCGDWNDSKHVCPQKVCKCGEHDQCLPDCPCNTREVGRRG